MLQFETEVPDPLCQNKPELLAPGRVRAPAVRILLLISITKHALERSPMQIQIHHIGRSACSWWQSGVEQLVDDPATCGANRGGGSGRWMSGNDDLCAWSGWGKTHIRAVKEGPAGPRGADG